MIARRTPFWSAALGLLLTLSPAARAGECLRKPLTDLVGQLAPDLKDKKITDVNLVQPVGPAAPLANAAPGDVRKVAGEVLAAAGFKVNPEAAGKILIDYSKTTVDKDGALTALDLVVTATDPESGEVLGRKVMKLTDPTTLARAGGNCDGPLDVLLNELAIQITKEVEALGKSELTIQSVQGPGGENSGIHIKMRDALVRQKTATGPLKVTLGAELGLRVRFRIDGAKANDAVYKFVCEIVDGLGNMVKTIESSTALKPPEMDKHPGGMKTLVQAAPIPGCFPPNETDVQRLQRIIDALAKRTKAAVKVVGEEVRVDSPEAKYAVEIWVGGKAVTPKQLGEHAVVEFAEGTEYQIVIRNRTKGYVAADVSIDGLSMFALRKTPGENCVAVGEGGGLVPGWYESNEKHYAFKTGNADTSPAAKALGKTADTGSITVTFRAAWDVKGGPPVDEPRAKARGARSAVMGTNAGPEGKSEYQNVKLDFGEIREVIVIRYAPKK